MHGAPLRFIGPLVDDGLHDAMALVDGTGPSYGDCHVEAVQFGCAMMSLVDSEEADRPAIAISWKRIELAWAAIGAIAIVEFQAMNFPGAHHLLLRTKEAAPVFRECGAKHPTSAGNSGQPHALADQ